MDGMFYKSGTDGVSCVFAWHSPGSSTALCYVNDVMAATLKL